jgi:uncharacterized protein YyaL (SSP411 family)
MADSIRFSHRPSRAREIGWRTWGPAAFEAAEHADRPVFLYLTNLWCHSCAAMDAGALSDPAVIELLNQGFISIRVDGDCYPHVQDRYIAGGWPTSAFLAPTGEVLWAATHVESDALRQAAEGVLAAWRDRRSEFRQEIERRRRALEASRSRQTSHGLVRREAADDVLSVAREQFDARNGGFGTAPKFPAPRAIELLYLHARHGDPGWADMADRSLDGIMAGELFDRVDGGFYRYALAEDWTSPRYEKLLDVNAALLGAFAVGGHLRDRRDWRHVAERTIEWVDRTLRLPDGLWGGSQDPDPDYFGAEAGVRGARVPPPIDATVFTSWNAQWIAALADAGARAGRQDWIEAAAAALATLLDAMAAPGDRLFHYREPGAAPQLDFLLADTLFAAIACLAVAEATGAPEWIAHARRLAHAIEASFWSEDGGLWDRARSSHDVGVLHYRERPFDQNADAARFFIDLAGATGDRKYRALSERILALLSPQAGRYGVDGAVFALAVEEYFDPPLRMVIAGGGPEAAELRTAALRLAVPGRRVSSVANGDRLGQHRFTTTAPAAAFACGARSVSRPVTDPDAMDTAIRAVS